MAALTFTAPTPAVAPHCTRRTDADAERGARQPHAFLRPLDWIVGIRRPSETDAAGIGAGGGEIEPGRSRARGHLRLRYGSMIGMSSALARCFAAAGTITCSNRRLGSSSVAQLMRCSSLSFANAVFISTSGRTCAAAAKMPT